MSGAGEERVHLPRGALCEVCRKPVFRSLHRYLGLEGFSGSEAAEDTALSVPLYPALADDEAAQICLAMRNEWRRE